MHTLAPKQCSLQLIEEFSSVFAQLLRLADFSWYKMLRNLARSAALWQQPRRFIQYKTPHVTSRRTGELEEWKPEMQSYKGYDFEAKGPPMPKYTLPLVWVMIVGGFVCWCWSVGNILQPIWEGRPRKTWKEEDRIKWVEKRGTHVNPGERWERQSEY